MVDVTATAGGAAADTAPPGLLVEPAWLAARLGREGLRVVDLREAGAHARSHVPGAVHVELAALGTTRDGLENVLLSPSDFAALMEGLGISNGDAVVAYDDQWGLAAARLVWALHVHGHHRVAVLDGGWDRWREEERPVTDAPTVFAPGRFVPTPDETAAATRTWLTRLGPGDDVALLDTRTRGEFDQGHLPGAVWWDWFNAVPPGSWNVARDLDELRDEWVGLGIAPEREVVVYCRTGMRAAHTYLVLKTAGYTRVRLYDGSWQEWSMIEREVPGG